MVPLASRLIIVSRAVAAVPRRWSIARTIAAELLAIEAAAATGGAHRTGILYSVGSCTAVRRSRCADVLGSYYLYWNPVYRYPRLVYA